MEFKIRGIYAAFKNIAPNYFLDEMKRTSVDFLRTKLYLGICGVFRRSRNTDRKCKVVRERGEGRGARAEYCVRKSDDDSVHHD